jgi:hypothetical protein
MAKALAGATVGQTLPVLYLGLKFGVSGTATYSGSPGVGKPTISTGVAGQFQDSSCSDSSGSGTVQSCNTNPTFTPVSGSSILYTTTTTNTGDVTVNINSLGAKHIRKNSGAAVLASGDLVAATPVQLIYDGTYWEIAVVANVASGFTAGGDLSGTSSSQTVVGFDGKALDTSMGTPSNGNIPTYDSGAGKWKAAAPAPPAVNAGECEMVVVGTGASYVLTTGDGTFYNGSCFNGSASTVTITGVYCLADTGTTTTVTPIVHGGGTILTGALTCGNNAWSATGTLSGTPTLSSGASVDPGMTATGTGHAFHIAITYH